MKLKKTKNQKRKKKLKSKKKCEDRYEGRRSETDEWWKKDWQSFIIYLFPRFLISALGSTPKYWGAWKFRLPGGASSHHVTRQRSSLLKLESLLDRSGREWCLRQPLNLPSTSCDLDLWPSDPKSGLVHPSARGPLVPIFSKLVHSYVNHRAQ